MTEVKNVTGYEGLYLIDNHGNVISMPKQQGRFFHNKYTVLSQKQNKYGYIEVTLSKEGRNRTFLLHRLLALHFIPNPGNLPEVNHKNGIKTDNRLSNLEWCSVSENTKHAFQNNLSGFKDKCLKTLARVNYFNEYVKITLTKEKEEHVFGSVKEAANFLGAPVDAIHGALRKGQRTRGYRVYGEKRANGES